jgi:uncharacterized protein
MTGIRSTDDSMIDDRRGQSSGGGGSLGGGGGGFPFPMGGGGGGGGGGFPFPMKAGGGVIGIVVLLASLLLPRLLNGGHAAAAIPQPQPRTSDAGAAPSGGACQSELEQVVCGAVNDVQAFWKPNMQQFFGVNYVGAKTTFFTGSVDTGCGAATSETGPFYCPPDQHVYIDLEFMQALEDKLVGKKTALAEQYIVAHEYGHHIQNLVGTNAQVQQAQQNDPARANQFSVAMELQADCYAGVWVGNVNTRGLLSANEVQDALDAAAGVGDDRIQMKTQGRIDKEAWTHGSAEQRQTWFTRGYNSGDPGQCDTFKEL